MKNVLWTLIAITSAVVAQGTFPQKNWKKYADAADAGFSEEKLAVVKQMHQDLGGAVLLVIYDGVVVLSAGDPTRKFMDHSMRKSYMSAMYGIYSQRGDIKPDKTLEQLNIDDLQPLTTEEKKATVLDLLSAKSGVYHPSAYSPRGMAERLPERGSHPHGTFWYYNNWDFNVLSTIFNLETGKDFFQSFKTDLADKIGMQDFDMGDAYYRIEPEVSKHPAYLFRLSARDQARFGLLYLRKGLWKGKQLIPPTWIEKSTSAITTNLEGFDYRGGYGYLWWTGEFSGVPGYYASGSGGQRIAVIPSRNLVIVQSTDTYDGSKGIDDHKIDELISLIIDAQTEKPETKPTLQEFEGEVKTFNDVKIDPSLIPIYSGTYRHRFLGDFTIAYENGNWILKAPTGNFRLHPTSNNEFIPEDILYPGVMQKAENPEDRGKVVAETAPDRSLVRIIFFY